MTRSTIDYGIDLGTTNSAIAVLNNVATEIVKNNRDADITPSAVSIDKKGTIYVGERAKGRKGQYFDDTHLEFKRLMGTNFSYLFRSSDQVRSPEDLSAEVLKSLRSDVQQRMGEIIEAAVITVPAAFELHQCDATVKAAQIAGIKQCPLLQEPVAAALAYGFQNAGKTAYWLVYDFGGGTFDAAIMKAEEGTIHVVNHGGDNFLGGSNIDWAIVEQILVPRLVKEFHLKDFNRGNEQWQGAFARLKRAAEIAKIDLSRNERATLDDCNFADSNGEEIDFDTELTRAELIRVAEPIILRSTEICKRVLTDKNLGKDAIERMILVGGPTLAPYFRDMLASSLGIKLDYSVDPLTVVARGAAVFAGAQRMTAQADIPIVRGEYSIELNHRPVGMDSAPIVGGKVRGDSTGDFTGFTVELVNAKTQWRSGKISLRADGVFVAHLHAEPGERNIFAIELCDSTGKTLKTSPDAFPYTIGAVVEEQPLIHSMGIALANNDYLRLFEKGQGLPLKATTDLRTVRAIRQGQSGELILIPIVEGDHSRADRNRRIADLPIDAAKIHRDLPAGTEVEVTLQMDESRILKVTAYVPILDEDFHKSIELRHHHQAAEDLANDFETEMKRFNQVKADAGKADGVPSLVKEVASNPLLQEVKRLLVAAKGDPNAAAECEKRLLELKLQFDQAADALAWPAMVAEVRGWLGDLQSISEQFGSEMQQERVTELQEQAETIISERKADSLRAKQEEIKRLYFQILLAQPAYWVGQFQRMEAMKAKMTDAGRASRLIDQGHNFIAKNNNTALENIVRQLWDLLPPVVAEAAQRGYQSGVLR